MFHGKSVPEGSQRGALHDCVFIKLLGCASPQVNNYETIIQYTQSSSMWEDVGSAYWIFSSKLRWLCPGDLVAAAVFEALEARAVGRPQRWDVIFGCFHGGKQVEVGSSWNSSSSWSWTQDNTLEIPMISWRWSWTQLQYVEMFDSWSWTYLHYLIQSSSGFDSEDFRCTENDLTVATSFGSTISPKPVGNISSIWRAIQQGTTSNGRLKPLCFGRYGCPRSAIFVSDAIVDFRFPASPICYTYMIYPMFWWVRKSPSFCSPCSVRQDIKIYFVLLKLLLLVRFDRILQNLLSLF